MANGGLELVPLINTSFLLKAGIAEMTDGTSCGQSDNLHPRCQSSHILDGTDTEKLTKQKPIIWAYTLEHLG